MSSTHSRLYYHYVFSTKERRPFLTPEIIDRVHDYLGGCLKEFGGGPIAIGGIADHVHILANLTQNHTPAAAMKAVKGASSRWISQEFGLSTFSWQEGYGVFTVSPPHVERVTKYILRQEAHHRKTTYQEGYLEMLRKGMVEFDERYVW